jgi:hypothetical protein
MHSQQLQMPLLLLLLMVKAAGCWHAEEQQQQQWEVSMAVRMAHGAAE